MINFLIFVLMLYDNSALKLVVTGKKVPNVISTKTHLLAVCMCKPYTLMLFAVLGDRKHCIDHYHVLK